MDAGSESAQTGGFSGGELVLVLLRAVQKLGAAGVDVVNAGASADLGYLDRLYERILNVVFLDEFSQSVEGGQFQLLDVVKFYLGPFDYLFGGVSDLAFAHGTDRERRDKVFRQRLADRLVAFFRF